MAGWTGSGTFTRLYSWTADAAAGINILATRMDADTDNITANGFNNTLTRDGQGSATANLPMNGFKHTGAGPGTAAGDYLTVGQTFSMSTTGVFNNLQMNTPFTFTVNGAVPGTEFQWSHPGEFATEGLTSAIKVPSTATVYQVNGLGVYVQNGSTMAAGAVGGVFYGRNTIAGATIYGLNPLVTDQTNVGLAGVQSTMVGAEFDIGAFNTLSVAFGLNMVGVFPNGTPATAIGYQASALNDPWQISFHSTTGAALVAFNAGPLADIANSNSQPINFNVKDAGNVARIAGIRALATASGADLNFSTPDGGVVLDGPLLASGLATFQNGVTVTGLLSASTITTAGTVTGGVIAGTSGTITSLSSGTVTVSGTMGAGVVSATSGTITSLAAGTIGTAGTVTAGVVNAPVAAITALTVGTATVSAMAPQWGQVLGGAASSWTDMSGSRGFGTAYTNSLARPIAISVIGTSSSTAQISLTVASSLNAAGTYATTGVNLGVVSVVPAGATYQADISAGTPAVVSWRELR